MTSAISKALAEELTQAVGQSTAGAWRTIAGLKALGVPKVLGLTDEEWLQKYLGNYIQLAVAERYDAVIAAKDAGISNRKIAAAAGVSEATIRRDLTASSKTRQGQKIKGKKRNAIDPASSKTQPEPLTTIAAVAITEDQHAAIAKDRGRQQKEEAREQKRQTNAAKVAGVSDPRELLKLGRFATIVLDPPWDFDDEGDVNHFGRGKHDFASMPLEQILTLPVDTLADTDCHLYLWITNRSLPKGFRLLEAWGFRYVTCLTWVKPTFGLGNYFRGQTEQILFGIKGSQSLKRQDVGTVLQAPRVDGHSEKPPEFFELVESCSPAPYLEFFQRKPRPGWIGWGEDSQRGDVV